MSRILRRPMFRGGPVDSRGSGITSGLDKPKRGLVNEPGGYAGEKSGMDFLRNALLGERFTNPNFKPTSIPLIKNSGFGFMTPERQSPGLIKIGEGISERNPRFDTLGIDQLSKPVTYGGSQEADIKKSDLEMGEGDIDESETLSSDFYETLGVGKVNDKPYVGGQAGSDMDSQEVPGVVKVGDVKTVGGDKEESVEYTVEDYIKMLGGDKARRRDLSDMLGRAAASYIGAPSLREGTEKFFESESKSGPSRREKIEQAAATLDIKDKISSKRAAEQTKQTLAGIDYKIGATMKAQQAAASLEGKTWINSLKYVSENLYKGTGKGLDSTSVIEDTLRLKYQKPVKKFTVSSETEIPKLEISEGFSIVVLPDGSKKIYEVSGGSAKERTDLRV
ncbi:hypothetical protein N9W19_00060 [bacterium]|nr:hypothetical protein [bacterium]